MRSTLAVDPAQWSDLTLSLDDVSGQFGRWLLVFLFLTALPHIVLWGLPHLPAFATWSVFLLEMGGFVVLFLVAYALSAVLHEALHATAMVVFAHTPWRAIHFGIRLREGFAYVHTEVPMTVQAYRTVLLFPLLIQGLLPVIIGLSLGNGWFTFYGFVMLISSIGDLAVLRLLQPLPATLIVRDHPTKMGCQIHHR